MVEIVKILFDMVKIFLIMLLFTSCGRANSEFVFQETMLVDNESPNCIFQDDCFCFDGGDKLDFLKIYFSSSKCQNKTLVDSVEFSPYQSRLHVFKSQNNEAHVVFWENVSEYYPQIFFYFVSNGNLLKMGEVNVIASCDSCENLEYPLREVLIYGGGDEILISFLKEFKFKNSIDGVWESSAPGDVFYFYNKTNKEYGFRVK